MLKTYLLICLFTVSINSFAAGLSSTRFIYNEWEGNNSATIISNDKSESLVQIFFDDDVAIGKPLEIQASPQLFKMNPESKRVIKLLGLSGFIKEDRESLVYMNVTTLPPVLNNRDASNSQNANVIINMRYKVFLRPKVLMGILLDDEISKVVVYTTTSGSFIENKSPLYLSINKLSISGKVLGAALVPPFSVYELPKDILMKKGGDAIINYVDERSEIKEFKVKVL